MERERSVRRKRARFVEGKERFSRPREICASTCPARAAAGRGKSVRRAGRAAGKGACGERKRSRDAFPLAWRGGPAGAVPGKEKRGPRAPPPGMVFFAWESGGIPFFSGPGKNSTWKGPAPGGE